MRLSRIIRSSEAPADGERVSTRAVVLWSLVGVAVLVGLVLYFRYERQILPVLG